MAVGFGFSVSDLCLALGIIKESIVALDKKNGASADFASLLLEIKCLEDGLDNVTDVLRSGPLEAKASNTLERAVSACQNTVEDFLESIAKYQPHLNRNASGFLPNSVKSNGRCARRRMSRSSGLTWAVMHLLSTCYF